MPNVQPPWQTWETIVRRDPGDRGIATFLFHGQPLGYGQLERAAVELARRAQRAAIITGFCIADANPPAAETDGPPGALLLARALLALDVSVVLVGDRFVSPLLRAGMDEFKLSPSACTIVEMPSGMSFDAEVASGDFDAWVDAFIERELAADLSHLVAIERAGPSHTLASVVERETEQDRRAVAARFAAETPSEHRNVHHNMRGAVIDPVTPPAHRIFERVAERGLPIATIGVGDGGNEIGMGRFAWSVLREAIRVGPAAWTACRVATDHTIVAGVSNWGAYALALGVAALRGRCDLTAGWTCDDERQLIERLVDAGAVDGVTKCREATIDGIALDEYLAVLDALKSSLPV